MFAQARIGCRQRETGNDERQHGYVKHDASDFAIGATSRFYPSHTLEYRRQAGFDFQQNEARK
jgi:hypothetical protein